MLKAFTVLIKMCENEKPKKRKKESDDKRMKERKKYSGGKALNVDRFNASKNVSINMCLMDTGIIEYGL